MSDQDKDVGSTQRSHSKYDHTVATYESGRSQGAMETFNKGFAAGVLFTCLVGWLFKSRS